MAEKQKNVGLLSEDMDPECLKLCQAINKISGLITVESCCGHDQRPFQIYFKVWDLTQLPHLLYWADSCHNTGFSGWRVTVYTDCGKGFPTFILEGPSGQEGYSQADKIAELLSADKDLRK